MAEKVVKKAAKKASSKKVGVTSKVKAPAVAKKVAKVKTKGTAKPASAVKVKAEQVAVVSKADAVKPVAAAAPVMKKRKAGLIRQSILSMLESGRATAPALLKAGKFSPGSFYLNLSQLVESGEVVNEGRGKELRLASDEERASKVISKSTAVVVAKTKAVAKVITAPVFVSGTLHEALSSVMARFAAPENIGEKLHTLEQLAQSLPDPVSKVLLSIHSDLMKLSPARG